MFDYQAAVKRHLKNPGAHDLAKKYRGLIEKGEVSLSDAIAEMASTAHDAQDKVTKPDADYVNGPVKKEPCKSCSMFIVPVHCTKVDGEISPTGHCKFWESKTTGDEFNEADHPRDKDGKFGSGGGGGEAPKAKTSRATGARVKQWLKSVEARKAIKEVVHKYKVPERSKDAAVFAINHLLYQGTMQLAGHDPNLEKIVETAVHEFSTAVKLPTQMAVKSMKESIGKLIRIRAGAKDAEEPKSDEITDALKAILDYLNKKYPDQADDAEFNEADHPRDESGKFGSGGKHSKHVSALKGAGLNQEKFNDAFNALKADKSVSNADLKKYIEEHTRGKVALSKTRSGLLDEIKKDWIRHARFENKISGDSTIALDRASVRELDKDGRLQVEITNISKANVCPYMGKEIPGFEDLRLNPEEIYQLYRDPEELARAAPSFNRLPVLSEHVPVFAADYQEYSKKFVIGATGEIAVFEAPFLRNSLSIWDGTAIEKIKTGEQKEISCGYHYRPDMKAGVTPHGVRFDGVMRDIVGNHVALVKEGRAGADVVVGDSKEHVLMRNRVKLTRQGAIATLALASIIRPKLAQDQTINLIPIVGGIPAAEFAERKGEILRRLERSLRGKLARDTSLGEVAEFLDMLDGGKSMEDDDEMPEELEKPVKEVGEKFAEPDKMDADPMEQVMSFLKGKLEPEDLQKVMEMLKGGGVHGHDEEGDQPEGPQPGEAQLKKLGAAGGEDAENGGKINPGRSGEKIEDDKDMLAGERGGASDDTEPEHKTEWRRDGLQHQTTDQPANFKGSPKAGGKMAGDKKYVTVDEMQSAMRAATESARRIEKEIREAERAVQPWVGQLSMSFDSAEEVFRKALKMMGVRGIDKVHADALRPILEMQPLPGSRKAAQPSARQAADAAQVTSFHDRFGDLKRIRLT